MTKKDKQQKSGEKAPAETAPEPQTDFEERRKVLSSIILDRLRKQDVVWVRIADPDVGRVDDLQIATKSRVDAYLVRWSEWPDTLTFDDLTSNTADENPLLKQLADGWKRLKKQYRLPVAVHLLTNDQPSARKIDSAAKSDCHLAKFLAQEWKRNKRDDEAWAGVWEDIRTATGLSDKQFDEFVECCKFDCSYARPQLDEEADEYQPYYWVEHIHETLFEHEDHTTLPIELNHAELLQLLGWRREQSRQLLKLPREPMPDSRSALPAVQEPEAGTPEQALPVAHEPEADLQEHEPVAHEPEAGLQEREPPAAESAPPEPDSMEQPPLPDQHASLSSFRGAAAWQQAAADSSSETADWLRAGASPPEKSTTDGAGQELPSPDLQPQESSKETSSAKPPGSPFVGKKQGKEKQSWKNLADKERQSPGPRKFNEPYESKTATADMQRISGKLRQMMSSITTEPDTEEEGGRGDAMHRPGPIPDSPETTARRGDAMHRPGLETFDPVFQEEEEEEEEKNVEGTNAQINFAPPADQQHAPIPTAEETQNTDVDLPPAEGAEEDADQTDTFTKISRLARKQEGTLKQDDSNIDAFNWYVNNANELFEESRFEEAEQEYIRALDLLGELDGPNHEVEFAILQNLGDIYLFLDKADKAVHLYEQTKEQRFTSKIPASKYIAALIKLGSFHEENNCFNDAEKQYRKAVEVAAEHLEKDDPILARLNEACLELARNRSTLASRFSATEVERIREMAKQETEIAIMYRKKKTTEAELEQPDIWKAGTKRQQEVDDDDDEPPADPRTRWMLPSLAVIVLFVFAYAFLIPHGGTGSAPSPGQDEEPLGSYTSADGQKVITLNNRGKSRFSFNGKEQDASYSFIGDTIRDLLPLVPGHLRTSYIFFNSRDSAIVDSDGTSFYLENSPELRLVKQMWKYARLAQGYRHEKKFYPASDEDWSIAKDKLTFINPITNRLDQGTIFSTTGEATDTPVRKSIGDGELWKGQSDGRPGAIICNVYNDRMFFIRAFDGQGKLLTGAEKGKCFYIECSDGIEITRDKLKELAHKAKAEPGANEKEGKKLRFVFAASPDVEARFALLLSTVPGGLLAFVLIAFATWRYRVNKKVAGPISVAFCFITSLMLIAWYVVAILDVK